jgi:hypothetical protein
MLGAVGFCRFTARSKRRSVRRRELKKVGGSDRYLYIQVPRNGARARVTYLVSSHSRQDHTDLPPSGHPFPVNPRFHYLVSETPSSAWCLTACMTNHNTPPASASRCQLRRGSTVAQFGLRTRFDLAVTPTDLAANNLINYYDTPCRIPGSPAIAGRAISRACLLVAFA